MWHSFRTGNRANIQNTRNIINKEKVVLEGNMTDITVNIEPFT